MDNSDNCPVCPKKINYTKESYHDDLARYIAVVKESDRANDTLYKKRLEICSDCKYYSNGLCTSCGCFVEIRCILKTSKCAAPTPLW